MKNFIIVAGVDYHPVSENKRGTDFLYYCNKHYQKLYLKEKNNKDDLLFYIIDIKRGRINLITHNYDSTSNTYIKKTSIYKSFDLVTSSNYFDLLGNGHKYFHPNDKNIISKFTIYQLIETIGIDNPDTLIEVSIFSHAYFDGPILLNSLRQDSNYFDYLDSSTEVDVTTLGFDPNDYDMRRWDLYDFYYRATNSNRLANLIAAFSVNGIFKIWGCSFPKELHKFLYKIRTNKSYKENGLTNTIIFDFAANSFSTVHLSMINSALSTTYSRTDKISLTFLEIKKIFCPQIIYTYASIASKLLDKKVLAALPATYAEISPTFRISPKVLSNVTFFKSYFNFGTDNLNYGIYEPDFNCNNFYQ